MHSLIRVEFFEGSLMQIFPAPARRDWPSFVDRQFAQHKPGLDHNPVGFSMWLAGAGVKGGQAIGATDELGFNAVEKPFHTSDLHATILHLMGLDHEQLTYYYAGMNQRFTGATPQSIYHGFAK